MKSGIAYLAVLVALAGCATQSPELDAYSDGTLAASRLTKKSALPALGVHKIALVVRERPEAAFDYYGFGKHFEYVVPQSELVPEGNLRSQMLSALKQQSELQVVDWSDYGDEFALATTYGSWSESYQVTPGTPAYSALQSMHSQGIDAVLLIMEHDNDSLRTWGPGHLEWNDSGVGPKGMCFCPPGSRSDDEMLAYDDFKAVIVSTADGKELDGRHYYMSSYTLLNVAWQAEYSRYSPQDIALMQDAVQGRENSDVLQLLRAFKILPATLPPKR